jgi:hypothetical protein
MLDFEFLQLSDFQFQHFSSRGACCGEREDETREGRISGRLITRTLSVSPGRQ